MKLLITNRFRDFFWRTITVLFIYWLLMSGIEWLLAGKDGLVPAIFIFWFWFFVPIIFLFMLIMYLHGYTHRKSLKKPE